MRRARLQGGGERRDRGQVLPLFAVFLVVLLGFSALAIDVSGALSARRFYRSAADAAALAGGQDLQAGTTRVVSSADRLRARADALARLVSLLGASGSSCATAADIVDCPLSGTGYRVSIKTPSPTCVTCDTSRAVQVTVRNPAYQLTFARILGQASWDVGSTSVAGLTFAKAYAIVTLRTPSSATIPGVRDIAINGGTEVIVSTGDVGTNANMTYSGSGSILVLDSGYQVYYLDPANPPLWGSNPTSSKLTVPIADPAYPVPSKGASPPIGAEDVPGCPAIATTILANTHYAPSVPTVAGLPDMTKIHCYQRGVYSSELSIPNGTLAILEPGLYFFDGGVDAQGSLIGGYTPNSEGVALVFRESQGTQFKNRTSGGSSALTQIVALNAGDRYQNPGGREATAAHDYFGGLVQTNTTSPRLMTVIVPPDPRCPVAVPFPSSTCTNTVENQNKAIDLSGGSGLYLAGVQYAPSDNITIAGNTTTGGYVGQVWAWTLVYTGGSQINQEGDQSPGPGVLRLDAACTAPATPCNSP